MNIYKIVKVGFSGRETYSEMTASLDEANKIYNSLRLDDDNEDDNDYKKELYLIDISSIPNYITLLKRGYESDSYIDYPDPGYGDPDCDYPDCEDVLCC